MIEFEVWRQSRCPVGKLSGFATKLRHVPDEVEYGSIQFGPLDRTERRDLVRALLSGLVGRGWEPRLLARSNEETLAGQEAVPAFVEMVGGDLWWIGDLAVELRSDDTVLVTYPDVDGESLDLVGWGTAAVETVDRVVEEARFHVSRNPKLRTRDI